MLLAGSSVDGQCVFAYRQGFEHRARELIEREFQLFPEEDQDETELDSGGRLRRTGGYSRN